MKVKVIGKQTGSFVDKATGECISYGKLSAVAPFPKSTFADGPKCEGEQALEIKVKPEVLQAVKVGSMVTLVCDLRGRVEEIIPA